MIYQLEDHIEDDEWDVSPAQFDKRFDSLLISELSTYKFGFEPLPENFPVLKMVMHSEKYMKDYLPNIGSYIIASEKLLTVMFEAMANIRIHPVSIYIRSQDKIDDSYRLVIPTDMIPIINEKKSRFRLFPSKIFVKNLDVESPIFLDEKHRELTFINQVFSEALSRAQITGYDLTPMSA